MSKVNMRARTLDPTKPMPIFNSADEPDILNPNTAISRAMLMMPTGMEKEEEEVRTRSLTRHLIPTHNAQEHHIQVAISQQASGYTLETQLVIPIPEASIFAPDYEVHCQ